MSSTTYPVMWGGACYTVGHADLKRLVGAGMAERSRREPNRYDGLIFATSRYQTPAEALSFLGREAGDLGAVSAATTGSGQFWQAPGAKAAPAREAEQTGRRGRRWRRR